MAQIAVFEVGLVFLEGIIHLVIDKMGFLTAMEKKVGPGAHILFVSNRFWLPVSTCAAPYFVAHIFQKYFQRQVAETIQT